MALTGHATADDYERTAQVGSFAANGFGLRDIAGNVSSGASIQSSLTHRKRYGTVKNPKILAVTFLGLGMLLGYRCPFTAAALMLLLQEPPSPASL